MSITQTKIKNIQKFHFLDPLYVIAQMEIKPGSIVADFGCGSGFFSVPLALTVGEEGKVYAIDILPQALEAVISRAKISGIGNIITKRANLENKEGSQMSEASVDWVVIKDMLHQNNQKEAIIEEACRILKPDGRMLIIEWKKEDSIIGPEKKLRLGTDEIMELLKKNKLVIDKIIKAGNFHYGMIVKK